MKFSELTVLLPCHSLEDFPVYHEGPQADELLAAWCVLWHPALVADAGAIPTWHRVDLPPEALSGRLIAVPPFCLDRLPAGFVARAQNEGATLVHEAGRDAALAAALAALGNNAEKGAGGIDEQLATDFLALGFCRLQIELLTRQMRYSTNIDETHFQNEAVAAAQAAVRHETESAREHLGQCFETLYEARKHFYPAEMYLLDLTLLAPTTLGESLARELARTTPTNLIGPVSLLRQISAEQPATWSTLLTAIDQARSCVVGGEHEERALPLLPLETARESIAEGVREYEALLGRRPPVYARRRCGLWPGLPQILAKFAFQGALHFTLDDGRFPLGPQSKSRWEGLDSSVIDIFARVPSDAAKAESFLGLSRKMADSMDNDHVATLAFAHWPQAGSPWYDVLRRIAELSPVLGKFMLLDDYFSHTDMPGRLSKFGPDEYRTPYLKQAIIRRQADPISEFVRAHRAQSRGAAVRAVATLRDLVAGQTGFEAAAENSGDLENSLGRLAAVLPRTAAPAAARWLVVNPLSFARRIGVELPWEHPPVVKGPVVAAGSAADNRQFAVVDVPALGFAWVEQAGSPPAVSRAKPIASENVLRNEFFEVTISRGSGGIQSIYSFKQRGNQLSQQIAFRLPAAAAAPAAAWQSADDDAAYTTMRAESVEVTASCAAFGEIVSRGALVDREGRRLAGFRQTTHVWAGSRVIGVEIELDDPEEPRADPWNSYYAARFAWPDETAELWRGVSLARQVTAAARLEAPEYINVENLSGKLSILTGGLAYHRRAGARMLDTLLVVRGETARRFSLGIGVDLPQPAPAAVEFVTPASGLLDSGSPATTASGWFFHVDARNILATHWEPLVDEPRGESAAAGDELPASKLPVNKLAVKGFRARLLETAGRGGRATLRAFRPVASARQVDFLGQTILDAPVEDDRITLDFAAHEWIEVEAVWSR
jgi:alpha-mannosidase